jgi:hypothetical protein
MQCTQSQNEAQRLVPATNKKPDERVVASRHWCRKLSCLTPNTSPDDGVTALHFPFFAAPLTCSLAKHLDVIFDSVVIAAHLDLILLHLILDAGYADDST